MNRIVLNLFVFCGTLIESSLWAAEPWVAHRLAANPWTANSRLDLQSQIGPATTGLPSVTTAVLEPMSHVEPELGPQGSSLIGSNESYSADHEVGGLLPTTIDSELAALNSSLTDPLAALRQIKGYDTAVDRSRHMNSLLPMQTMSLSPRFEALPTLEQPAMLGGVGAVHASLGAYQP